MLEINEKLKHLTEDQIHDVMELYKDKTIKLNDIIEAYAIKTTPAMLVKLFPPVETDQKCMHCGSNLYETFPSRSDTLYDTHDKFCLKCGHKEYARPTWHQKCKCQGCKAIEKAKKEEEKARLANRQERINAVYGINYERVRFDDMALSDQILLVYVLGNYKKKSQPYIDPCGNSNIVDDLTRLYEIKALTISPNSSLDAFPDDNFPYTYYPSKVRYNINVEFTETEKHLLQKCTYFTEVWDHEDLLDLYKDYLYEDLVSKFEYMMTERGLELRMSKDSKEKFFELIDDISYTKISSLCFSSARFFSDKVLTGNMSRTMANNLAFANVYKFYNNAIENGWTITTGKPYPGKRLLFFIENIINQNIDILEEVASENLI